MISVAFVTCGLVAVMLRLWMTKLPVNEPKCDRWNCQTVHNCGGLMFFPVCLPFYFWAHGKGSMAILAWASLVIWSMGFIDDIKGLAPSTKLQIESALAVVLIISGWRLEWFDHLLSDSLVSFVWIVGLTNAFNLIDNMDGLAGGVTLIAATWLAILTGGLMPWVLAGVVGGFLVFNFPPAKVFMGDTGALFLGMTVACLAMELKSWNAVPLLLVPIADTTFVTTRRLLKGRSPTCGGLDHLSHEIQSRAGLWPALLVLWGLGLLGGFLIWIK